MDIIVERKGSNHKIKMRFSIDDCDNINFKTNFNEEGNIEIALETLNNEQVKQLAADFIFGASEMLPVVNNTFFRKLLDLIWEEL